MKEMCEIYASRNSERKVGLVFKKDDPGKVRNMHVLQDLMDSVVWHGKDARFLTFTKQQKSRTLRISLSSIGAFFQIQL